jgi:hypothetical protein
MSRHLPSKQERRAVLRAAGWQQVGSSWRHPRYPAGFFSLAAAYRVETGIAKLPEEKP